MVQEIITYLILAYAFGAAFYRIAKTFMEPSKTKCSDCFQNKQCSIDTKHKTIYKK
jgi:hypothetical protein